MAFPGLCVPFVGPSEYHITSWHNEKAAVTRLTVLEEPHVIAAESLHELLGHVHLAKRQLVVIAVVQDVEQVCVERVDVLQKRKKDRETEGGNVGSWRSAG